MLGVTLIAQAVYVTSKASQMVAVTAETNRWHISYEF